MQITGLSLSNWLTHHHLEATFKPFTFVTGPNGGGKTAIRHAIDYAFTANGHRVEAKGDRGYLVAEGQDSGSVTVHFPGGSVGRSISTGKLTSKGGADLDGTVKEAIPFVLDFEAFQKMTEDGRRSLLLRVMKVDLSSEGIKKALIERKHDQGLVDQLPDDKPIEEMLAAAKCATSDARGTWKAITGEVYGAQKAEGWKAPAPRAAPDDGGEHVDVACLQLQYDEAAHKVETARNALIENAAQASALKQAVTILDHEQGKLAKFANTDAIHAEALTADGDANTALQQARDRFTEVQSRMPGVHVECPHCRKPVTIEKEPIGGRWLTPYDHPANPATDEELDAAERAWDAASVAATQTAATLQRAAAAANARRELEARIDGMKQTIPPEPGDTASLKAALEAASVVLEASKKLLDGAKGAGTARQAAAEKTAKATHEHGLVKAWAAIAVDLEPSGVPAAKMRDSLATFNETLTWLAGEASWPAVAIGADMSISRTGRRFGLLSEAEQWRVNTLIALALALESGLRFAVIDRFDVLQPDARAPALAFLQGLAPEFLDTLIVLGTMSRPPEPRDGMGVLWLGDAQ